MYGARYSPGKEHNKSVSIMLNLYVIQKYKYILGPFNILIQHQRKLNDRQGKSVLEEGRPPIGEKKDCKFDAYRDVI